MKFYLSKPVFLGMYVGGMMWYKAWGAIQDGHAREGDRISFYPRV